MSGEDKGDIDAALRHLEELIERLDQLEDGAGRESARQLVEVILDLHGIALARLISVVAGADGGSAIMARLSEDDRVRPLLLLHGLHPEDVETRVRRAAERLTPHLGVQGLRLEVAQVTNGTARLRVLPSEGVSVKSSLLLTLPMEIERAIIEAAPDLDAVEIDDREVLRSAAGALASN